MIIQEGNRPRSHDGTFIVAPSRPMLFFSSTDLRGGIPWWVEHANTTDNTVRPHDVWIARAHSSPHITDKTGWGKGACETLRSQDSVGIPTGRKQEGPSISTRRCLGRESCATCRSRSGGGGKRRVLASNYIRKLGSSYWSEEEVYFRHSIVYY